MLDQLNSADFSPYRNQVFQLHLESAETLAAELLQVTGPGSAPQPGQEPVKRRPFSLIFRCGPNTHLRQQIYRLTHEQLGPLDIFLVPIGPDQQGMCYEAVFN
jgi:hypothetical protein